MKMKRISSIFLSALMAMSMLAGTVQAALLDFGPVVPEVVGSTPPNIQAGFPLWFRDTNRVPLQLCLEEVPGCLFAAVDRPNLAQPLAFPNIPDELFYYSATATIGDQLLFAGVEMNFADNGNGTYDQVGFSRVRIRIDSTIAGNYTVTTPWKQYFFTVDQATITANNGRRVINATEDIGLRPDGEFAGILTGNVGPYGYSQGAPFVTAAGSFLGDNTPRPLVGTPNNIFRIEGPAGFATVETNQFSVTGKLYADPIPTLLVVDKATYTLDNRGMQVNSFATTQAMSNQVNGALAFPLNFALTNAPSALQLSGVGIPTQILATNSPADGKFFAASGLFAPPGSLPATVTMTNTADTPQTIISNVPLVDDVIISSATYNPLTGNVSIVASSSDLVNPPELKAYIAGTEVLLGTLVNGQLTVALPKPIGANTYNIPSLNVTVKSAKLGSATAQVSVGIPVPASVVANFDIATIPAGTTAVIDVLSNDTSATSTINPTSISVNAATGGLAAANPDGTVTYTAPTTTGYYAFNYTVKDNASTPLTSNVATVTVTVIEALPVAPTLVGPNGIVVTTTPTYTWNAVANATNYTIYTDNNGFTSVTAAAAGCPSGIGTCSVTLATPLQVGVRSGWVVKASNASGDGPYSSNSMSVTLGAPPSAPTLVGPSGTVLTATPTYTWNAVANATNYTIYTDNNGFTTVTAAAASCPLGIGTCSVTLATPLQVGITSGWVVKASNAAGDSPYSPNSMSVTFQ